MDDQEIIEFRNYFELEEIFAGEEPPDWIEPRPAAAATKALPGTQEKIEVLRERIENGEELWHTQDPRITPDARNDADRHDLHIPHARARGHS